MSDDPPAESRFHDELSSLVRQARGHPDAESRQALFEQLASLERRALAGGAPERVIHQIAEARFLAGILREAVVPVRLRNLRGVLRLRAAAQEPESRGARLADGLQA